MLHNASSSSPNRLGRAFSEFDHLPTRRPLAFVAWIQHGYHAALARADDWMVWCLPEMWSRVLGWYILGKPRHYARPFLVVLAASMFGTRAS